jgi:hypothetical protein
MGSPLKAHEAWSEGRDMVDERPRLVAPEIEEELFPELQKLAMLRDTQSVTIRPYSGPKSWTWELDRIEPEVGPGRASSSMWLASSLDCSSRGRARSGPNRRGRRGRWAKPGGRVCLIVEIEDWRFLAASPDRESISITLGHAATKV